MTIDIKFSVLGEEMNGWLDCETYQQAVTKTIGKIIESIEIIRMEKRSENEVINTTHNFLQWKNSSKNPKEAKS